MSIETDIAALLKDVAEGGIWPVSNVDSNITYPYLTYIQIGSVPYTTLSEEIAGKERVRMQIDAHGLTYKDAFNLAQDVNALMPTAPFRNTKLEEHDMPYDAKGKTFIRITDYYCWTQ